MKFFYLKYYISNVKLLRQIFLKFYFNPYVVQSILYGVSEFNKGRIFVEWEVRCKTTSLKDGKIRLEENIVKRRRRTEK